ncbi:ATP-binding protein [Candidatus Parcubacteria bacterium]|nr:ATP-binding protein [Candidatus Parcubacteria bacterium]
MKNLVLLEEIIIDQLKRVKKKEKLVKRDIDYKKYTSSKQIIIVSGIRRCGKSSLLKQFMEEYDNFYYINFDDERLIDFNIENFNDLMLIYKKKFKSNVIFIDEIQNIPSWERFVRRIYDDGYKIFITGSNAKLLSSELATHLTGRYFKIELYPFSFKEYLSFKNVDIKNMGSDEKARIIKNFDRYFQYGGFPEFVKTKNDEYLKMIYNDILYKDLLTRFNIREVKSFKQLINFLYSNVSKNISYNNLKNILNFKSATSVKNYIEFSEEAYLLFELYKYDFSLKKQYLSDKKVYVIDNGLRNAVAFYFSKDKGKLLENLVFLNLKRTEKELFFSKDKYECDFIIKEKNKIITAIQVSYVLNIDNRKRELNGLIETAKKFKLKNGIILTYNQEENFEEDKIKIKVIPVWKWLILSF